MVIVGGEFEVEPERREAFLAAQVDAVRRSRSEPGCLEYIFSADPLEPGRVALFERWETQAALDAHLSAMAATPASDPAPVQPSRFSIMVCDVAGERPLGG